MKAKLWITKATLAVLVSFFSFGSASANLITDGDFDSLSLGMVDLHGGLNNFTSGVWNVEGTNQVVPSPHFGVTAASGTQMLRFDHTGGANAQTQQYVAGSFLAGSALNFNVDLNGSSFGANGGILFATYNSLGGPAIDSQQVLFNLDSDTNTWENLAITDTLSSDANFIEVQVFFNNNGLSGGRYGFMDNAELTVSSVPEPSTYALLLSGLLGLAYFRKSRKK